MVIEVAVMGALSRAAEGSVSGTLGHLSNLEQRRLGSLSKEPSSMQKTLDRMMRCVDDAGN